MLHPAGLGSSLRRPPRPQPAATGLVAFCRGAAPSAHKLLGQQQQRQQRQRQRRLARRLLPPATTPPAAAAAAPGGNGAGASSTIVVAPSREEERQQQQQQQDAVAAGGVGCRGEAESGSKDSGSGTGFVWTRHWWPLLPEAHLKTDRPNAVTVLGMPLVIWWDRSGGSNGQVNGQTNGQWRVFRDRCPHRLAPLSEGRLEADGSLACSYHGWRFEGSGACRRIPQSTDAAAEAAACGSRRACATAFPTRLEAGMLWVWPDDSPDAATASAAASTVMSFDLRSRAEEYDMYVKKTQQQHGDSSSSGSSEPKPKPVVWFVRDMSYGYEVLLENLTDPSHLPFSHHGRAPVLNRNTAGAMPMNPSKACVGAGGAPAAATTEVVEKVQKDNDGSSVADGGGGGGGGAAAPLPRAWTRPAGPTFELDFVGAISPDATISVHMPYHVMYTYRLGKIEILTELFAIPVGPGRSRFLSVTGRQNGAMKPPPPATLLRKPELLANLAIAMWDPVVFSHKLLNDILDGDSVFLTAQDELIREAEDAQLATAVEAAGATAGGGAAAADTAPAAATSNGGNGAGSNGGGGGEGLGFWSRLYYLPAQSDRAVLAGRRWLEEVAGGGPFRARQRQLLLAKGRPEREGGGGGGGGIGGGGVGAVLGAPLLGEAPSPAERARRLDRFEQHTRHCPTCSKWLEQLRWTQAALKALQAAVLVGVCGAVAALGAAAAVAAAGVAGAATATTGVVKAAAAALAALAAVWAAAEWLGGAVERLARIFLFQDYVHADKN